MIVMCFFVRSFYSPLVLLGLAVNCQEDGEGNEKGVDIHARKK